MLKNKTVVLGVSGSIAAYKIANLANASALLWEHLDCINWAGFYMMEDGAVIEEGTHASLMEKGGKYAEMFRLQAENYKEGEKDE